MTHTCSCHEHRGGGATVRGAHTFGREEDDHPAGGLRWRWLCGCGSSGKWQAQSPNVAYHAWLTHAHGGKRRR